MNLRQFVTAHATPYDPAADGHDVPAFLESLTASKATAVYAMHSYHQGKKPHDAIRRYIRHYTRPGDLVLDPFCGSGGTALAAVLEGRKAVALDRSPAAAFIARNYSTPADPAEVAAALGDVLAAARPELDWLYETRCDRCDGPASTQSVVSSEQFACPGCLRRVPLVDCPSAEGRTAAGRPKFLAACPHCLAAGRVEEIRTRGTKLGAIPVLATYRCAGGCRPEVAQRRHDDPDPRKRRYFEKYDLGKLGEIERHGIPHWWPPESFPTSFARWRTDLRPAGIGTVADLYTKRNLWALAALRSAAVASPLAERALFALTAISLAASKMQRWSPRSTFPNMLLVGTYYVPPIRREINAGKWYEGKVRAMVRGYAAIRAALPAPAELAVATADARQLDIPSDSIDYIFTDPPYADNVQYGELNFVWESWLGLEPDWHAEEIVVNAARGKTEADWAEAMRRAMGECHRVLKPGRWLSLCYHDAAGGTWAHVQDVMAEAGFSADPADSTLSIDTRQKSFNQLMSDKATKRDLVVNFQKSRDQRSVGARLRTGTTQSTPFRDLARQIVREYLAVHSGATKDRIYDDLVSRLVRRGRMEPHDFEALLRELAREVRQPRRATSRPQPPGRWYLK
ncbi:MAG: DNA methyltransferase [Thermoguttaceae bacterium]